MADERKAINPFIKKLDVEQFRKLLTPAPTPSASAPLLETLGSKSIPNPPTSTLNPSTVVPNLSASGSIEVRGTLKARKRGKSAWMWVLAVNAEEPSLPGRDLEVGNHIQGIPATPALNGVLVIATIDLERGSPRVLHSQVRVLPPYPHGVISQSASLTLVEWMGQWEQDLERTNREVEQAVTEKALWEAERETKLTDLQTLEASIGRVRKETEEIVSGKSDLESEKAKLALGVEGLNREFLALEAKQSALLPKIEFLDRQRRKYADIVRGWVDAGWISDDEAAAIDPPTAKPGDRFVPHTAAEAASYIDEIHRYLVHDCDLNYPLPLVENIFALLATHDTLVFAGSPGSGKTAFVRAFSKASSGLEATIIPVKPNWTSGEDLFGYWNPAAGHFVASDFTAAIIKATANPDKLSLICLDEMNLARVEYYFADLLSVLENRNAREIQLIPDSVIQAITDEKQRARCKPYHRIAIPPNIRIIGCLNMDETTLALSPKVLDRVHVIQFPDPLELPPDFAEKTLTCNGLPLPLDAESFNRCEYPSLRNDDSVCQQLINWREKLTNIGITLSPRVIRQAMNYRDCLAKIVGENMANWQALNNTCLQKFVPRLERDMPDQAAADARHASVKELIQSCEKLAKRFPNENGKPESSAASALKALYEAADKRPDKRYSVWK